MKRQPRFLRAPLAAPALRQAATYALSTGALLIGSLAQLGTFVLLARHLGVEAFGALMMVTAGTNIALQASGLGSSEGMVRRVSRDRRAYPEALGHSLLLVAATGVPLAALVAGAYHVAFATMDLEVVGASALLALAVANIVLARLVLLAEDAYLASGRVAVANIVNVSFALVRLGGAVAATLVLAVGSLDAWAWIHGAVHLAAAGIAVVALLSLGMPVFRVSREELRLGYHFTTPLVALSLRQNVDLIVLGFVVPAGAVGAFAIAKRILETALIASKSVARLAYPHLARAGREGIVSSLAFGKRLLSWHVGIGILSGVALVVLAPIVPVLFGPAYAESARLLGILCLVPVLAGVQMTAYDVLGSVELHRERARTYLGATLVGAGLIAAASWAVGITGTLAAVYATELGLAVLLWRTVARAATSAAASSSASTA